VRIGSYLIYETSGISAVEIATALEGPLLELNIQAVACYGEKKSNLILEVNDDALKYRISKAASIIFNETVDRLKRDK